MASKYQSQVEAFYDKNVKGKYALRGRAVPALKAVLLEAAKKGQRLGVVLRHFVTDKGIEAVGEKPATNGKAAPRKAKAAKESPEEAADKAEREEFAEAEEQAQQALSTKKGRKGKNPEDEKKAKVKQMSETDTSAMDRRSLKGMIAELQNVGAIDAEFRVKKSMTDEDLRAKIQAALDDVLKPAAIKALEKIDPTKLEKVLKQDCFGIFVDLKTPVCVSCADAASCAAKFVETFEGDLSIFKKAMEDADTEDDAKATSADDLPDTKTSKGKKNKIEVSAITYDPKRPIFVADVKNPNKKGDEAYEVMEEILGDNYPKTMKDLRKMFDKHGFDMSEDDAFMAVFKQLRTAGIILLKEDM